MVSCAKAVVAKENANARQTGGGKPMPIPDDTTLAIIQDMKGTPAFSGIPGSSASESAIVAVNRQDEPQKDPFNLLGFDALTGSPSRTWSMFEVACSSGEADLDDIEGTETKICLSAICLPIPVQKNQVARGKGKLAQMCNSRQSQRNQEP
ncbi:hypothetical protein MAR_034579 [Mya arenaria]|uniref:Uncharacterized protein n=1 Tax=Mya arenaria TaxID=6604 RepID=A0ABY7ELJ5_MYAAR|nr:hypothetical protein MAR_034579 [Mya arenaria]